MKRHERLLLIDSLLDGSISEADLLRIEAELSVDPRVRQEYYERIRLDLLLEGEAAEQPPSPAGTVAQARTTSWPVVLVGSLLSMAAIGLVIVSLLPKNRQIDSVAAQTVPPTAEEPTASGFAVLHGQDGAVWSGEALGEGDLLPTGELHLRSGRVHIELFSGVQMILEGESRFSIDSPMQVTLARGSVRARVPEPAQGFRIKTSSGDVVDLGTEFTVDAGAERADVHVVDGEVELQPDGSDALRIATGLSARLSENAAVASEASTRPETVGPAEFQDWLRQKQRRRFQRWSDARSRLRSDPRGVAYYDFQASRLPSRQIDNLASAANGVASDGTVVAAAETEDRWGRSDAALDFSRVGSRVRVDVAGEFRGLTLMCWVKINSLDRWYNSLFLTDGHDDGEPHWQWMDDGRIFFSVKVPRPEGPDNSHFVQPVYYSPKIWKPSLSGRWIMLAVTYDVDRRQVTHFLNGAPISRQPIAEASLVESIRIGSASIGNWSEPMYRTDPKFVIRNLNGSMDEFMLFAGALSADEISQFYRDGNPNGL